MEFRALLMAFSLAFAATGVAQVTPEPPPPDILHEGTIELVPETQAEPQIFTIVEEMPEVPGGHEAMLTYIQKNLHYPGPEREAEVEGKVFVTFVVNKDGALRDAKVLRGVPGGPGLDKEALRLVREMPN